MRISDSQSLPMSWDYKKNKPFTRKFLSRRRKPLTKAIASLYYSGVGIWQALWKPIPWHVDSCWGGVREVHWPNSWRFTIKEWSAKAVLLMPVLFSPQALPRKQADRERKGRGMSLSLPTSQNPVFDFLWKRTLRELLDGPIGGSKIFGQKSKS